MTARPRPLAVPQAKETLELDITVNRGSFTLRAAATVAPGQVLAVIGANGSGKTTMLSAIAGVLPIAEGRIALGGVTLDEVRQGRRATRQNTSVKRSERRIGYLTQRANVFPHLDARANVAFGPRAQGRGRREADSIADAWLSRVGLDGKEHARARDLSGGQQQRVALARTLAADPALLLLDEPFAALDVGRSDEARQLVRDEVRRLEIPTVLITHSLVDAIGLADTVLVLDRGRVAQYGDVARVLSAPATPFAAEFTGRVLLEGVTTVEGHLDVHGSPLQAVLPSAAQLLPQGTRVTASYDPAHISLTPTTAPPGPVALAPHADNAWVGTIAGVAARAAGLRVEFAEWPGFAAQISVEDALAPWLAQGARVRVSLPADALRCAAPAAQC